jgi:hypothetical protein
MLTRNAQEAKDSELTEKTNVATPLEFAHKFKNNIIFFI